MSTFIELTVQWEKIWKDFQERDGHGHFRIEWGLGGYNSIIFDFDFERYQITCYSIDDRKSLICKTVKSQNKNHEKQFDIHTSKELPMLEILITEDGLHNSNGRNIPIQNVVTAYFQLLGIEKS